MITRYTHKDIVWVDVQSPTREEARTLTEEFNLHELVGNELLAHTLRPKVDLYPNLIYLILHFPTITHKHDGAREQEIDFVIGKNFLITTHYDLVDSLHEFSKVFEVNSILEKSTPGDHAGFVFFQIIRNLYKALDSDLEHISRDLVDIESKIFDGKERAMVGAVSRLNRDLLNVKQTLRPHKEVLESFEHAGKQFFGTDFSYYLRAIVGEYYKVSSRLDGHRETLLELRDTNDSLLTTKTNEIMKSLTVMAFVILPLTFIGQLFGMSSLSIPIISKPGGFGVILCSMGILGILLYSYFKFVKKWM
ncbi:MAG: CorA family divalent cation transporter [Patescibacteria group bacterium]